MPPRASHAIRLSLAFSLSLSSAKALGPYQADANTTFLYHFDEPAETSVARNDGTTGYDAITYDGPWAGDDTDQTAITTALGATSFAGFLGAATVTQTTGIGVDLDGNGGYRTNDSTPISPDRFEDHTEILGTSFTLEAMINIAEITGQQQEIIATDTYITNANGGNDSRGFQFRIVNGTLEFFFIGSNVGDGPNAIPIPTAGTHGFVADQWFHAAVAFDGTTMSFYWTRVDSGVLAANLIGTAAETIDLSDPGSLVIGNEGRSAPAPAVGTAMSNEGLRGLIDEARISNVARAADEFIFANGPAQITPIFTNITRSEDGSEVVLTWNSRPAVNYVVQFSTNLENWEEIDDSWASQGQVTTYTDTAFTLTSTIGNYRVFEGDP